MIGCEDRLRNDLYCVEWGVKLYSNSNASTPPLSFYRPDALPAAQPISVKALKAVQQLTEKMLFLLISVEGYAIGRVRPSVRFYSMY